MKTDTTTAAATASTPDTNTVVPDALSYKNLVDLMAINADASGRLALLEVELQGEWLALVDTRRAEYAKLQGLIGESEEGIEELAKTNPQWFEKSKTLKTPYGTVSFRTTTKLSAPNEEVTIALIDSRGKEAKELFIRETRALNLESLEKLDDLELQRLHITREKTEICNIKPAKVDLGKAVKKAAAEAAKADKANA